VLTGLELSLGQRALGEVVGGDGGAHSSSLMHTWIRMCELMRRSWPSLSID